MRQTIRARSIDRILDDVFRQYRDYFVPLILLGLILIGPFALLYAGASALLPSVNYASLLQGHAGLSSLAQQFAATQTAPSRLFATLGLEGAISLAEQFIAFPLLFGTYYQIGFATLSGESGERPPMRQFFRQAVKRWGAFVATGLLVDVLTLLIFAGYFALSAVGVGIAFAGAGRHPSPVLAILLVAVYLVFLAGVIWVYVRMYMLLFVTVVIEKKRNWGAIARVWKLTKGSFWRLFGIQLLAALVVLFASWGLSALIAFLLPTNALRTASSGLVGVFIQPLFGLLMVNLYVDLRVRREGYDLELLTQEDA